MAYRYDNEGAPTTKDAEAQRQDSWDELQRQIGATEVGSESSTETSTAAGGGTDWGSIGSLGSGILNSMPDWYSIEHGDMDPSVVKAVYGDSSEDPIARLLAGHGADMANATNNIWGNSIDYSGIKNNTNLMNAWDNNTQNGINGNFGWSNVADNLTAFGKGASYGAQFGGGWGALIGGIIGGVANIGSQVGFSTRAKELSTITDRANQMQVNSFYNTAKNNNVRSQRANMMHMAALGGSLANLNRFGGLNGIEHFNVGGSHEQNPNEGIQQGIAPDGAPNLVEEGEIKYNDYIYSKRIKPTKSLLKKNNLPEKYYGLSYAEIADKLQKESEDRPNDPISKSTLDSWMSRLQTAQEETKMANAQRQAAKFINSLSDEEKMGLMAIMQQQAPMEEMPEQAPQQMMAKGGSIHIDPSKKGTFTAAATKHGMGVQEFASKVLANPEDYSASMRKKANFAKNASKWHDKGGHLFDGETGSSKLNTSNYSPYYAKWFESNPEFFYDYLSHNGIDAYTLNLIRQGTDTSTIKQPSIEEQLNTLQYLDREGTFGNLLDYDNITRAWDNRLQMSPEHKATTTTTPDQPYYTDPEGTPEGTHVSPALATGWSNYKVTMDPGRRKYGYYTPDANSTPFKGAPDFESQAYRDWWNNVNGKGVSDAEILQFLKLADDGTAEGEQTLTQFIKSLPKYKDKNLSEAEMIQAIRDLGTDKKYNSVHGAIQALNFVTPGTTTTSYSPNYYIWNQDDPSAFPIAISKEEFDAGRSGYIYDPQYDEGWSFTDPEGKLQNGIDKYLIKYTPPTIPKARKKPIDKEKEPVNWGKYLPILGNTLLALTQTKDYRYADELRRLAGQYNPVAAPSIGGYRRYTPYDVNLGDAENMAMEIATMRENRGLNRASQAGLNAYTMNQYQKAQAARNLEWLKANEANRLAVDTYNHAIDKENMALVQAYDQLNANIRDKKLGLLERAAGAADASDTAWAESVGKNATNAIETARDLEKEDWNRRMAQEYIKTNPELDYLMGYFRR